MELGNIVFGNSRGEHRVPRGEGWEEIIIELIELLPNGAEMRGYGVNYDNETFSMMPYYWGDCPKECGEFEHTESCRCVKPNFLHKPTGFEIQWYKYIFRDSYMSDNITRREFQYIIDDCIKSISENN